MTFCILPLLAGLTLWFKIRARQRYREVRLKLAAINSFLQEQITGMSVVQLFNQEKRTFDGFSEINDEHRVANVATIFYYAVYYPAVELVTALGAALILWYGGGQVLGAALSVGALVAFRGARQSAMIPLSTTVSLMKAEESGMRKTFGSGLLALASLFVFGAGAAGEGDGEGRKLLLICSADERNELHPCG